jgi:hypothetical protein
MSLHGLGRANQCQVVVGSASTLVTQRQFPVACAEYFDIGKSDRFGGLMGRIFYFKLNKHMYIYQINLPYLMILKQKFNMHDKILVFVNCIVCMYATPIYTILNIWWPMPLFLIFYFTDLTTSTFYIQ